MGRQFNSINKKLIEFNLLKNWDEVGIQFRQLVIYPKIATRSPDSSARRELLAVIVLRKYFYIFRAFVDAFR